MVLPQRDRGDDVLARRAGIPQAGFPSDHPRDNPEVLVCLMRTGLIAHHAMVGQAHWSAISACRKKLGKEGVAVLLRHVDRLTDMAAKMLDAEKGLN
jgi:hypothetical protein